MQIPESVKKLQNPLVQKKLQDVAAFYKRHSLTAKAVKNASKRGLKGK